MIYKVKRIGFHWQAWKLDGHKVIKKGHKRMCRIDAFMDAKEMEMVEKVWVEKKCPLEI